MDSKEMTVCVRRAGIVTLLLAIIAIAFATGMFWYPGINSPPSVLRQAEEVAALETHVLPLVEDLRATWYLKERFGSDSIHYKRGNFAKDPVRARQDGDNVFDSDTEQAFEQFTQAIRISGVPTNRLREAKFAGDGTVRAAAFQRRGGGLEYVFTYIYSPGENPEEWTSPLGPVVLTRIGDSDWWFEQSPND